MNELVDKAAFDLARKATEIVLSEPRSPKRLLQLSWATAHHVDERLAEIDKDLDELHAADPDHPTLACKKGCSFCCHLRVYVFPPEVFRIVDFVERSFDGSQKEALARRLEVHVEALDKLEGMERLSTRLPCPFLEDDLCSIYEARPTSCRAHHSIDVGPCRDGHFGDPNAMVPQVQQRSESPLPIIEGCMEAAKEQGLAFEGLGLAKAVQIALQEPDCTTRWLEAEDVFAPAGVPDDWVIDPRPANEPN